MRQSLFQNSTNTNHNFKEISTVPTNIITQFCVSRILSYFTFKQYASLPTNTHNHTRVHTQTHYPLISPSRPLLSLSRYLFSSVLWGSGEKQHQEKCAKANVMMEPQSAESPHCRYITGDGEVR